MAYGRIANINFELAKIVSVVFHPILIPLYGLLILISAPTFLRYLPSDLKIWFFIVVLINNVIVPLSLLPFYKYRNVISSYNIEEQRERIIPLFTASILYCTTSFIVFRFQIPFFMKSFVFAVSALSIVVSMINFWWKVSIHSVGAGVLTATVFVLSYRMYTPLLWYLLTVIMIDGLVLSSRLKLNYHNPQEVWGGFLIGFVGISLFVLLI